MHTKNEIMNRINYLQKILIQMSFVIGKDRPELYQNVLSSLHSAQQMLLDCKKV